MGQFCFHRIPAGIDNCYLLCGNKKILIDGGAPGSLKEFQHGLNRLGMAADDIDEILLTHGHADHIGSLHALRELTGARVWVHQAESSSVEVGKPELPPGATAWGRALIGLGHVFYRPSILPCKVDHVLDRPELSLSDYGIPGILVHTPGHSAGSVCVLLQHGEVFAGDMAMNAWYLRSTPGLPVLAEDMSLVVQSWKKLIRMGARRVYPAHGQDFPITVIEQEILQWERRAQCRPR